MTHCHLTQVLPVFGVIKTNPTSPACGSFPQSDFDKLVHRNMQSATLLSFYLAVLHTRLLCILALKVEESTIAEILWKDSETVCGKVNMNSTHAFEVSVLHTLI
jgi:hypothetical protein